MSSPKYLITGPTGATGSAAITELLKRGHAVRALAHRKDERSEKLIHQGVEVVYGDLNDFNAIVAAMKGIERAYYCYPLSPGIVQSTALFTQAAKDANLQAIVNMSQVIARTDVRGGDLGRH